MALTKKSNLQAVFGIDELPSRDVIILGGRLLKVRPCKFFERPDITFAGGIDGKNKLKIVKSIDYVPDQFQEMADKIVEGYDAVQSKVKEREREILAPALEREKELRRRIEVFVENHRNDVENDIVTPTIDRITKSQKDAESSLKKQLTDLQKRFADLSVFANDNFASIAEIAQGVFAGILPSNVWYTRMKNGYIELCIDDVEWKAKNHDVDFVSHLNLRVRVYRLDKTWNIVIYSEGKIKNPASFGNIDDNRHVMIHPHISLLENPAILADVGRPSLSLCFWKDTIYRPSSVNFIEFVQKLKSFMSELNRLLYSADIEHFKVNGAVHIAACVKIGITDCNKSPAELLKIFKANTDTNRTRVEYIVSQNKV